MELKFESPIERRLYEALAPKIRSGLVIETQVPVLNYRVDMMVRAPRPIVIECDGAEYHKFWRDRERDEDMIDRGGVWQVIRFKGSDIVFGVAECVEEMRKVLPTLFYETTDEMHDVVRAAALRQWDHLDIQPILRGPRGEQHKSAYWRREGQVDRVWKLGDWLEFQAHKALSGRRVSPNAVQWAKTAVSYAKT